MSPSVSTPRLRLTIVYYLSLLAVTAVSEPRTHPPEVGLAMTVAAFLLVSCSALGRIWCSVFIAGRKDSELVTSGPYALCRHPLYVLSILGGIGLGLATHSLTLTAVTFGVLTVMLSRAASTEERILAERHGAKFSEYAARVPRWWPRLGNWHLPPAMHVHADILWKAFVDAGAFLLLYAAIVAARALRASDLTPALLALP